MDDPSVRQWLERYGDWLGMSQLIGLMVASVIGFMQRSKGLAMFFTHVATSVCGIVLFIGGVSLGYGVIFVTVSSSVVSGALGMVLFRLLISISDKIDRDKERIAGRVVDSVPLPGAKSDA